MPTRCLDAPPRNWSPALRAVAVALVCWSGTAHRSAAHDIPNERVDRAIQVTLAPGKLRIDYDVSMAELTLVRDLRQLVGQVSSPQRDALLRQYAEVVGPLNARGFLVTIDGREVSLGHASTDFVADAHPRLKFHFTADLPARGRLRVQDTNYVSSEGTSRLALRCETPMQAPGYQGPSVVELVNARPVWMLSDAEEHATTHVSVDFTTDPIEATPDSSSTTATRAPAPDGADAPVDSSNALTSLLRRGGSQTWIGLWAFAVGLGVIHALQPGHGKSVVAATSLGLEGGWVGGIVLGLATTVAHFASVFLIAGVLWFTPVSAYASIHSWTSYAAGAIVGIVGFGRVGRHLAGRPDHPEPHVTALAWSRSLRVGELIAAGFAGGVVPCWDAVLLVVIAALAGVLAQGLLLLLGFSVGMAVVLVTVGISAGKLRATFATRASGGRWSRGLGLASGVILAAMGVALVLSARL